MKKVGVFVDVTQQFAAVQKKFTRKINYEKYLMLAKGDDCLLVARAYGVQLYTEADGFINRLKTFGYFPRYWQVATTREQKVDLTTAMDFILEISMDIIRYHEKLDCVILGSNDLRLIPLIKLLQERGIQVVILACEIPKKLAAEASRSIEISEEILEKGKI